MTRVHDLRQLYLMLKTISAFKEDAVSGNISSLLQLSNNLEALLNSLSEKDRKWNEKFIKYWGELEITSSFMLQEDNNNPDYGVDSIAEAIQNLEIIIHNRIQTTSYEDIEIQIGDFVEVKQAATAEFSPGKQGQVFQVTEQDNNSNLISVYIDAVGELNIPEEFLLKLITKE